MRLRLFQTHKLNESKEDCQDWFAKNEANQSLALSDGMSSSVFQKEWAQLLTESFVKDENWSPDNLENRKEISAKWIEDIKGVIEKREKDGLKTWNQKKILAERTSGCATFLGVRIKDKELLYEVLGDTALVVLDGSKISSIITSQPEGEEFDNFPDYYDSYPDKPGKGTLKRGEIEIKDGISFLMVSDPFSDFLDKKKKEGDDEKWVNKLLNIDYQADFEDLVEEWRKNDGLKNDDSTLIIIDECGEPDFKVQSSDPKEQALQAQQENEKLREENNVLKANNAAIDAENKTCKAQIASLNEECSQNKGVISKLKEQVVGLQDEIDKLSKTIEQFYASIFGRLYHLFCEKR